VEKHLQEFDYKAKQAPGKSSDKDCQRWALPGGAQTVIEQHTERNEKQDVYDKVLRTYLSRNYLEAQWEREQVRQKSGKSL
jgi:hypothetical protein